MIRVAVGIDVGTSGVKALALDCDQPCVRATTWAGYPTNRGPDGRHEQDPHSWWVAVCAAVQDLATRMECAEIVGIGLSGHMHALLLIGEDGEPLGRALTWADRRVGGATARLSRDSRFRTLGGNDVVDAFTAPKLAWAAEHRPETLSRTRYLAAVKDYIGYRLTGTWVTDRTDAIGTLLFDLHREAWDPELFARCGASRDLGLPVHPSGSVRGSVTRSAALATGLPEGVAVSVGAGDVAAVFLGSAAGDHDACLNAGTAAQVMVAATDPDPGPGFIFGRADSKGYLRMASVYAAGDSIRWAQQRLLQADPGIADSVPPDAAGLTYLPFMYGASVPRKNDNVRAALLGQQETHGAAEVMAAVIDGVGFACADALAALVETESIGHLILMGGVTRSRRWCQLLASLIDAQVVIARNGGSTVGAAILGATAGGAGDPQSLTEAIVHSPVAPRDDGDLQTVAEAYDRYQDWCARLV